jgi:hypothetical protein
MVVDFPLFRRLFSSSRLLRDEVLLNGYNFLIQVSVEGISLVKHLIDGLNVVALGDPVHQHQAAQEVAQLALHFLAVVRLVNRDVVVHWVRRQECQLLVWVTARGEPLHLEIWHEHLIALLCLVVIHLTEAFEALWLVVGVWLTCHFGNSLDHVLLLGSKNENHILHGHEGMR